MTLARLLACFVIASGMFGIACEGEDDEACGGCGEHEICSGTARSHQSASGDIEVHDADGRAFAFLLQNAAPSLAVDGDSVGIHIGAAQIEIPRPLTVGSFPVEGRVCDRRSVPFECARFRATVAVAALDCGPLTCDVLSITLQSDEPDDASPAFLSVHGSLHVEREKQVEHRCVPDPESRRAGGGCSGGPSIYRGL